MNIERSLKKEGIEVISRINTFKINAVAKSIAEQLCVSFPELELNYKDIFRRLCHLKMYRAKMPFDLSQAKYFYKNSSIYLNKDIPFDSIEDVAIHECIHYLQEKKDENNNLLQLGLYKNRNFKSSGMALNEAAVQLMSSRCLASKKETVKYFGITLTTTSPNYYPLECSLVEQIIYLLGDSLVFESTLLNTENFQNKYISLIGSKNFFAIEKNMDILLTLEEKLNQINTTLATTDISNKTSTRLNKEITYLKEDISTLYLNTQNLIYTSYFNQMFTTLKTKQDIANFRNLLYYYTKVLGTTENYTDFQKYYEAKTIELDKKFDELENPSMELTIVEEEYSFIKTLVQKVSKLTLLLKENLSYINNKN